MCSSGQSALTGYCPYLHVTPHLKLHSNYVSFNESSLKFNGMSYSLQCLRPLSALIFMVFCPRSSQREIIIPELYNCGCGGGGGGGGGRGGRGGASGGASSSSGGGEGGGRGASGGGRRRRRERC